MKKIKLIVLSFLLCMPLFRSVASASEQKSKENEDEFKRETLIFAQSNDSQEAEDRANHAFAKLKDTDGVLKLEDGGYLYGEAIIDNGLKGTSQQMISSLENPKSITVADAKVEFAKEIELSQENSKNNLSIMPRGSALPPDTPQYTVTLNYGARYISQPFSAKGLRFSEKQFSPASGTGDYLRWCTHYDSGRVGSRMSAALAFTGSSNFGIEIQPGTSNWIACGGNTGLYWTYNPIAGSYYCVANIAP